MVFNQFLSYIFFLLVLLDENFDVRGCCTIYIEQLGVHCISLESAVLVGFRGLTGSWSAFCVSTTALVIYESVIN